MDRSTLTLHHSVWHATRASESPDQLGGDAWTDVDLAKKQLRDSAYYEERLKRDHPTVYGDLKAGKFGTVADAAIAAELKKPRTRLQELKNAWSKATPPQQDDFLRWLVRTGVVLPTIPTSTSSAIKVAVDRRLTPGARHRINDIMAKRSLKPGDVMAELGHSSMNPSLGMAIARGTRLTPDMILTLEKWPSTNRNKNASAPDMFSALAFKASCSGRELI